MNIQNRKWKPALFVIALLATLFVSQQSFAEDTFSFALEAGGIGSEGKYTTDKNTYTMTTFDPDFRLRLDIPIAGVKDNSFFNICFAYDFSWKGYYSSDSNLYTRETAYTNMFSLLPELVFQKDDFRFFIGTGLTFGISSYESKSETTTSDSKAEFINYRLLWDFELGAKYYLTYNLFLITDFSISIPIMNLQRDSKWTQGNSSGTYSDVNVYGNQSMWYSPKVGIGYCF